MLEPPIFSSCYGQSCYDQEILSSSNVREPRGDFCLRFKLLICGGGSGFHDRNNRPPMLRLQFYGGTKPSHDFLHIEAKQCLTACAGSQHVHDDLGTIMSLMAKIHVFLQPRQTNIIAKEQQSWGRKQQVSFWRINRGEPLMISWI